MQIRIDGVDITDFIKYQGVKWSRNDVDGTNAGRNLSGTMIRDRVATKIKLEISCRPLLWDEHKRLMNLLLPEFVTVSYTDPMYGNVSKVMYANNNDSTYMIKKRNGKEYWYNVSFPLVEK